MWTGVSSSCTVAYQDVAQTFGARPPCGASSVARTKPCSFIISHMGALIASLMHYLAFSLTIKAESISPSEWSLWNQDTHGSYTNPPVMSLPAVCEAEVLCSQYYTKARDLTKNEYWGTIT